MRGALRDVLCGAGQGAHRDCLLLGAALALEVAGRGEHRRARPSRAPPHAIDSGAARRVLDSLAGFSGMSADFLAADGAIAAASASSRRAARSDADVIDLRSAHARDPPPPALELHRGLRPHRRVKLRSPAVGR